MHVLGIAGCVGAIFLGAICYLAIERPLVKSIDAGTVQIRAQRDPRGLIASRQYSPAGIAWLSRPIVTEGLWATASTLTLVGTIALWRSKRKRTLLRDTAWIAVVLTMIAGLCHEKPRTTKDDLSASADRQALWEIQREAARREGERQREATMREEERLELLQRLSPLEMALERTNRWVVDFVALMEISPMGDVHQRRCLGGRIPSDVQNFVARGSGPGSYLVGRLVPFRGYSIYQRSRHEEIFCYDVTNDGNLVFGEELSTALPLDEIEMKLAQQSEQ